jgi:rhodanese-related sulfurtransferase
MVRRVSASEAHALIRDQGFVYVDVRSEPELRGGVPSGAYHVPLLHMTEHGMQDNREFLRVMQATFARDQKLIIGCESGVRSLRAATLLASSGFVDVIDQRGGFSGAKDAFGRTLEPGWRNAGLPVSTELEPDRSYGALSQRMKAT